MSCQPFFSEKKGERYVCRLLILPPSCVLKVKEALIYTVKNQPLIINKRNAFCVVIICIILAELCYL